MHFIHHHMFCSGVLSTAQCSRCRALTEFLVVDRTEVYVGLQRFTSDAACEHVLARVGEAVLDENAGHVFDLDR